MVQNPFCIMWPFLPGGGLDGGMYPAALFNRTCSGAGSLSVMVIIWNEEVYVEISAKDSADSIFPLACGLSETRKPYCCFVDHFPLENVAESPFLSTTLYIFQPRCSLSNAAYREYSRISISSFTVNSLFDNFDPKHSNPSFFQPNNAATPFLISSSPFLLRTENTLNTAPHISPYLYRRLMQVESAIDDVVYLSMTLSTATAIWAAPALFIPHIISPSLPDDI